MNIKDLAVAKELSHEERAVVRGGNNLGFIANGPQSVSVAGASGLLAIGDPTITTVVGPTNTQTQTDVNVTSLSYSVSQDVSAVNSVLAGFSQHS